MTFADFVAHSILNDASDAIIAADREGIIRLWNSGAERIFGYRADEAQGRSLDIIIPERLRERHWAGYRQVIENGASRYGKGDILAVPGLRKEGARVSLEFTIVLLKDERERVQGIAAILRDVTSRYDELKSLKTKLATVKRST
jgi:PAS domain S-box-containing protein